jgi:hypothetical protein
MRLRTSVLVATLLLASVAWTAARATTILRLPVEEMAANADLVVRADVTRVAVVADPDDERRISTRVSLRVRQVLKGHATAPTFTITLLGGSTGRWTLAVPGTPRFIEGEDVVLFLHATERGFKPSGLWLGKYAVRRDAATGGVRASRVPAGGALLSKEADAIVEEEAVSHADDDLDLDDLVRRVRAGAAAGGAR